MSVPSLSSLFFDHIGYGWGIAIFNDCGLSLFKKLCRWTNEIDKSAYAFPSREQYAINESENVGHSELVSCIKHSKIKDARDMSLCAATTLSSTVKWDSHIHLYRNYWTFPNTALRTSISNNLMMASSMNKALFHWGNEVTVLAINSKVGDFIP